MSIADLLINTLCSAGSYALLALAVVFVYSTNRVLVFCVGEIGALAAFVAHGVATALPGAAGAVAAVVVALALAALIGAALCWIVERLGLRGSHFVGTIITIAFALVLQGLINTVWQGEILRFALPSPLWRFGDLQVPGLSLAVAAIGLSLAGSLLWLLERSPLGFEVQALADNRLLSLLRGIPVGRRIVQVGAASGALAGAGGLLSAAVTSVSLEGASIGVGAIIAAIIGGLTSPVGAVVGAVLLALVENLTAAWLDPRHVLLTPVILLCLFLVLRPYGVLGRAERIQRV